MSLPYLWTEQYRPKTLDQYVWRDPAQRAKVEEWVKEGVLPHLMLTGGPGTGKTSLAEMMLRVMGIPSGDILKINASRERKIEDIQNKVINFVSTWALGDSGVKYVILDEADSMSPLAQKLLRGEMETYSDGCRFILTANYPAKIIPALHSRCQGFHFEAMDRDDFTARVGEILVTEDVNFEVDDLLAHVDASYPDLRKCIGNVSQSTQGGKLSPPTADSEGTKDYLTEMTALFKAGRTLEARKLIVEQAQVEEYPDIYRYLYKNLDLWGDAEDQQDDALLVIRRGLVNHALVCDPEINLAACLVELCRIQKQ